MAFPRLRLRAHEGGMCSPREPQEAVQAHAEFRGRHVIRVSSKAGVPPTAVSAAGNRFAKAAEVLEVFVIHASFPKRGGEGLLSSPRDPPGHGEAADGRKAVHSGSREQSEEFFKGPG